LPGGPFAHKGKRPDNSLSRSGAESAPASTLPEDPVVRVPPPPGRPPAPPKARPPDLPRPAAPVGGALYWPAVASATAFALLLVGGVMAWAVAHPAPRARKPAPQAAPDRRPAPRLAEAELPPRDPTPAPTPLAELLPATAATEAPAAPPPVADAAEEVAERPKAEKYGTSVLFLADPGEAARQARRGKKLLLVLHVSGNFEESCFT
jgi:hypothetical protein